MSSRRDFIKKSCGACAALGLGIFILEESCSTGSKIIHLTPENDIVSLPLKSFSKSNSVQIRVKSIPDDIILIKKSATEISAFLMKCTHKGEPLVFQKNFLFCPAHGSAFDLNGNVIRVPAKKPLTSYAVRIEGEKVVIALR